MSKVHHCVDQIKIAEGKIEPPAGKCRCRKEVELQEATRMVRNGEASWTVIGRRIEAIEVDCPLCHGDEEVQNCANCRGAGRVPGRLPVEDYGDDIVLVSRPPADKDEKKQSSALAQKTPRVATIERAHIERAYVYGGRGAKAAQERIEEYGRLNKESLLALISGTEPIGGWVGGSNGLEYERNPDWGRSTFSNMPSKTGSLGGGSVGRRISAGFNKIRLDGNTYGD